MPHIFQTIQPTTKNSRITRSQARNFKNIRRVLPNEADHNFNHVCKTSINDRITTLQKTEIENIPVTFNNSESFLKNHTISGKVSNISVTFNLNSNKKSMGNNESLHTISEIDKVDGDSNTVIAILDSTTECANEDDVLIVSPCNDSVIVIEDSNLSTPCRSHERNSVETAHFSSNKKKHNRSRLQSNISIISIPDEDEDQNTVCDDDKDIIFVKEDVLKPNMMNLRSSRTFNLKSPNKLNLKSPSKLNLSTPGKSTLKSSKAQSLSRRRRSKKMRKKNNKKVNRKLKNILQNLCMRCKSLKNPNCNCDKNKFNMNLLNCNLNEQFVLQSNLTTVNINKSTNTGPRNLLQDNRINSDTSARSGLREIVIDGSNVAFGHTNGRCFSVKGLKIVIDYFLNRGHKVTAFVPQYRQKHNQSTDSALLNSLADKGFVVFTPSREVNGRRITPYDDRYIIQYASSCQGIVVSSDNYRDLFMENPQWHSTIEHRLLMPTWVGDVIMFPEDPLGRHGPNLSRFLKFP